MAVSFLPRLACLDSGGAKLNFSGQVVKGKRVKVCFAPPLLLLPLPLLLLRRVTAPGAVR